MAKGNVQAIIYSNIPLVKASYMAEPRDRVKALQGYIRNMGKRRIKLELFFFSVYLISHVLVHRYSVGVFF